MTKGIHRLYISTLVMIVIVTTIYLSYIGYSYYILPLEERFYHPQYDWFKPGGTLGHGLGILGTLMILFGVTIYIARKRYNFMSKYFRLKYLLEFHIFLCTLGPILIVFHTSFKIGGIVSIAFWCMVAVVLSGVIGRFIYIQIPRTIEGRELGLNEVQELKNELSQSLVTNYALDQNTLETIKSVGEYNPLSLSGWTKSKLTIAKIKSSLKKQVSNKGSRQNLIATITQEVSLSQKIKRLQTMQKLFKYWHVAHLPFALIMLVIVLIHVVVTLALGYKWIF
ncbi:MAG: hypothetical protein HKO66_01350 [Saprospiraceae bacterium]|nr:hypothetical protein [Bacteroidia bacterium]NNL90855.1 hypothetical protein [Saprospiraceae bacterium]